MIKAILSVCILFLILEAQSAPIDDERPEPYSFSYDTTDEYGTQWTRSEEGDANGNIRGSYGYKDATGLYRMVTYEADDINGFRASVDSNEPGLKNSAPAGVTYNIK